MKACQKCGTTISIGATDCAKCGWVVGTQPLSRGERRNRSGVYQTVTSEAISPRDSASDLLKGGFAFIALALILLALWKTGYTIALLRVLPLPQVALPWIAIVLGTLGLLLVIASQIRGRARTSGTDGQTAPRTVGDAAPARRDPLLVPQTHGLAPVPFWRDAAGLVTQLTVRPAQVAQGATVPLTLPSGKTVEIRLDPVIRDGYAIRANNLIPEGVLLVHICIRE